MASSSQTDTKEIDMMLRYIRPFGNLERAHMGPLCRSWALDSASRLDLDIEARGTRNAFEISGRCIAYKSTLTVFVFVDAQHINTLSNINRQKIIFKLFQQIQETNL